MVQEDVADPGGEGVERVGRDELEQPKQGLSSRCDSIESVLVARCVLLSFYESVCATERRGEKLKSRRRARASLGRGA